MPANNQIEVFVQGGLGNQIIQCAYASSVAARTGSSIALNNLFLSVAWARIRRITYRKPSQIIDFLPVRKVNIFLQLLDLFSLKVSLISNRACVDGMSDAQILRKANQQPNKLFLLGYFQRQEAFQHVVPHDFWSCLAKHVRQSIPGLKPFSNGQVVVHVRLGDYLVPENQKLFASQSLDLSLVRADSWMRRLGNLSPLIHVVTDDARTLRTQIPRFWQEKILILEGGSPEADFILLARHKHIVAANSTFSLCAGRLSSELWGPSSVTLRPDRWYVEDSLDRSFDDELRACAFCLTAHQIGL